MTCAASKPSRPAPHPKATAQVPPEVELEALLHLLRELPRDCPEYARTEARVASLVRPYLVRVARAVAREWDVAPSDLVQEGLVAVLLRQRRRPFDPGRAGVGRSAFPAFAMKLGRQAMVLAATRERCPVYLTDHARKALRRAKREARQAQTSVPDALAAQGVEAATAHALGDGTVQATLPVEELLGLAAGSGGPERAALQARAMAALHALPRLQRLAVAATVGVGQPEGKAATERTLAVQLHLTQARVRRLRTQGLRRLRELLAVHDAAPARAGSVRRTGTAAARQGQPATLALRQLKLRLGAGAGA
ncbi:hypothetical protein JY651_07855 [Pyxidicoccus parkwayensis]|uniref:RNA polymerase sigma-70 region 2 domain-containing protein n=1 Tax=Pyxidicoccus parkwayensis TaxID=2813578 RepID=A0ABX7P2Z9_9BACT|nr:hypothetical protein [Pyxidicoccus parkwaysis]QSQ24844.1 hypothetical protein JY651_07855 [Pyxidicoccus parkwaysis]